MHKYSNIKGYIMLSIDDEITRNF
ncbi:uncharacterized protein METZ01_LOCUS482377 [marine metagenome]|uniref:Uncharacterized protein n=1 Tax=marine metagenome TaxID=408172 RepID=A0A383CBS9_9ZZZZ